MSQEKLNEIFNYILVSTGTFGTATVTFWQNIDLGMSLFLKLISLVSFICFLLINQDKISDCYSYFQFNFLFRK